ncbi:MAG: polysaccharide biosynthesis protein [Clostridia bacterium]|nr:polysaccharide biosynthesis protein [Clostridia bacterium]
MSNEQSKAPKKQSFLGGAAVLALATAIVKIIGAIYKIPLQRFIGEAGFSYFNTAYDIYSVLLMISTTGLPVAMSRMISEAQALGQSAQIRNIYKVSRRVFLLLGLIGTVGMAALCVPLAMLHGQKNAWFAILCLSPAVLFICITSSYRGFFQGQGNMTPTSVSQVMEALCKLVIGLGLAIGIMYLFRSRGVIMDKPDEELTKPQLKELNIARSWAAGGAIIGVTSGCLVAMAYLFRKHRKADNYLSAAGGEIRSNKETIRELLRIAIPITIGAAGLQLITSLDSIIYMWRLKTAAGFDQDGADSLKGIYNFCQTIFNLPCAFITPIVVSSIPAITEHITMKNKRGERIVSESAIRVMSLIALPCAIGLAVLSVPIYKLLASYDQTSLKTAGPVLSILGVCVVFNAMVLVTNAIMQAHGDVNTPVIHMLIGGVLKLIVNFILVSNPAINIKGAAIGTLICYIAITVMNLIAMLKRGYAVSLVRTVLKPLAAALIMGAVAFFGYRLIVSILSEKLATVGAIIAAGICYVIFVLVLRVITKEDCELLPKGDKIAKILKIH